MGARRRKLLGARDPAVVEKSMKRALDYSWKAREKMRGFDDLPPLWRALINFFGADVCARVCERWPSIEPELIPAKLGKKAEFEEYYEEAYGRKMHAKAIEEKERISSAWDGFL